jgi:4-alpha-glucanotransferase
MHISSLPSKFGIGDLGPESYKFAKLLKKSKQHYWSILPLSPTSRRTKQAQPLLETPC